MLDINTLQRSLSAWYDSFNETLQKLIMLDPFSDASPPEVVSAFIDSDLTVFKDWYFTQRFAWTGRRYISLLIPYQRKFVIITGDKCESNQNFVLGLISELEKRGWKYIVKWMYRSYCISETEVFKSRNELTDIDEELSMNFMTFYKLADKGISVVYSYALSSDQFFRAPRKARRDDEMLTCLKCRRYSVPKEAFPNIPVHSNQIICQYCLTQLVEYTNEHIDSISELFPVLSKVARISQLSL
jgi:hypothetical protein